MSLTSLLLLMLSSSLLTICFTRTLILIIIVKREYRRLTSYWRWEPKASPFGGWMPRAGWNPREEWNGTGSLVCAGGERILLLWIGMILGELGAVLPMNSLPAPFFCFVWWSSKIFGGSHRWIANGAEWKYVSVPICINLIGTRRRSRFSKCNEPFCYHVSRITATSSFIYTIKILCNTNNGAKEEEKRRLKSKSFLLSCTQTSLFRRSNPRKSQTGARSPVWCSAEGRVLPPAQRRGNWCSAPSGGHPISSPSGKRFALPKYGSSDSYLETARLILRWIIDLELLA